MKIGFDIDDTITNNREFELSDYVEWCFLTNKKIEMKSFYNAKTKSSAKMKYPINNLDDTNLPGLVISILHQGLENIDKRVLLIATSNKYEDLDQGLISRFDRTIDFNQYSKEDLLGVAEGILTNYLAKAKGVKRDLRLFRKILTLSKKTLFPKELENLIKSSLAFSDTNDSVDYLRKLYVAITGQNVQDVEKLQDEGFTPREVKSLTSK